MLLFHLGKCINYVKINKKILANENKLLIFRNYLHFHCFINFNFINDLLKYLLLIFHFY